MTFPSYSAYKDSGVEWLGEVPEHWGILTAKRLFGNVRESAKPDAEQLAATQAYGVIPQKDFMEKNDVKVVLALSGTESFRGVRANDFVISLRSFQGGIEHSAYDGCVSPAYTVLRRRDEKKLSPGYFRYLLKDFSYISALQSVTTGIREGRTITYEQFGSLSMPVAPVAEQTQIARFLDHETARIDALIEEQQRLIELLKEKRQAVITHAVTKGLDPTVPMKDSGVEWLGEVPEHWAVAPIKFFFEFLDGQRIPIKAEDRGKMQGDYPYYGASGIIDHVNDFIFEEDLVLVSEDGANLLMRSTPIAFVARGKYWVNNHAHILRPQDSNFTYWAEVVEQQDLTNYVTGSAQPKLTAEALGSIKIAVPPTESERAAIQGFVLKIDTELGSLLSEAECGVRLLQERRSALISAAVTGKIDVRNWQPPASVQAPEVEQEAV